MRVHVHETVGGRGRFIGADDHSTNDTEGTTNVTMDIKAQFLADEAQRDADLQRAIAGDFQPRKQVGDIDTTATGQSSGDVTSRDAFLQREAARSRQPARGVTGDVVSDIDDDDEGVSLPRESGRDAYLARESERSRLPARGAR